MRPGAVTFDFGQTLTELDCSFLCEQIARRGLVGQASELESALPSAWRRYDEKCAQSNGAHPWHLLMKTILVEGMPGQNTPDEVLDGVVDWLWTEQPERNLWRKPIPGMIELVRKVAGAGTPVAVISNSEGHLALLAEQLAWQQDFQVIADSGVLGFEKPGAQIFEWTGEALGVAPEEFVHIGDSWAADVQGVLEVGGRAIWFTGATVAPALPAGAAEGPRVDFGRSVEELEALLRAYQVPL